MQTPNVGTSAGLVAATMVLAIWLLGTAACAKKTASPAESSKPAAAATAPALSPEEEEMRGVLVAYFVESNRAMLTFDGDCDKLAAALLTAAPAKDALLAQAEKMVAQGYAAHPGEAVKKVGVKVGPEAIAKDASRELGVSFEEADATTGKAKAACADSQAVKDAMDRIGVFKKKTD